MRAHLTGTNSADTPLCGVSAREKVFRKQITTKESAALNVSPLPAPRSGAGSGGIKAFCLITTKPTMFFSIAKRTKFTSWADHTAKITGVAGFVGDARK